MAIYAIGDLHLSFQVEKPMDVFGWEGYEERIRRNWTETVEEQDTVFLPGDFSWATYLPEAVEDFRFLNSLPGNKVLLKGNHDYWWETRKKMEGFLEEHGFSRIAFLHNNSVEVDGIRFCGTKGWDPEEANGKIVNRETQRFLASLSEAREGEEILGVFHYPPYQCKEIMDLIREKGITECLYGHVHGPGIGRTEQDGIRFIPVSCDVLGFLPLRIR
ncbi:MAG: metallophosphoesterase [Clostridia bacterium]